MTVSRLLRGEADLRRRSKNIVRDDLGRAVITMNVRDDSDFVSPYSVGSREIISSEVAGFLTDNARAFHPTDEISLHIVSDCIDEKEKRRYPDAISGYFYLQALDNERELRRNMSIGILMLIVGVLALAGMFAAEHFGLRQLWIECIDIFAWVFIWEAVDQLFIERGLMRLKKKRLSALMNMDVRFFPAESD